MLNVQTNETNIDSKSKSSSEKAAESVSSLQNLLYSKYQHGQKEVVLKRQNNRNVYEVTCAVTGLTVTYTSARQLVLALHNSPESGVLKSAVSAPAPKVKPVPEKVVHAPIPVENTLEESNEGKITNLLYNFSASGKEKYAPYLEAPASADSDLEISEEFSNPDVVEDKSESFNLLQSFEVPKVKLGIDLETRSHEVRKILFASFGYKIHYKKYDPEDVLQEVYKGILTRNNGKCPWDIRKSSFGHYVYMVCNCVLSNYHRKQSKLHDNEVVGLKSWVNGEYQEGDVGLANVKQVHKTTSTLENYEYNESRKDLLHFILKQSKKNTVESVTAVEILKYINLGLTRKEMAKKLSLKESTVGRGMIYLRKCTKAWQELSQ